MSEYIKLFNNHNEYTAFTQTEEFVKPNVSHCITENEVHYNPFFLPIIATFNVTDVSSPTQIYAYDASEPSTPINGEIMFDSVEIDGVKISISDLDTAQGTYVFNTSGEHTVKYVPKDPTLVGVIPSENVIGATFYNCPALTSITIPNSVTTFGNGAFGGCSGLTSVNIPNGVTSIGFNTFNSCASLTNITIPNGVTEINSSAFEQCTSLTNVIIPNSVMYIDWGAFANCSSLTSVTIGSGVTNIGGSAFASCTSLTSATCLATTPPEISLAPFSHNASDFKIYVPSESVAAYKSNWDLYANDIEAIS